MKMGGLILERITVQLPSPIVGCEWLKTFAPRRCPFQLYNKGFDEQVNAGFFPIFGKRLFLDVRS
jgi:hypothetical protein